MKIQLQRILEKWGLKSREELSADEKATFNQWEAILSQEVTVDTIAQFCDTQIRIIQARWDNPDTAEHTKADLIPYHTCYRKIAEIIRAPQTEKENLERHLNELLKS